MDSSRQRDSSGQNENWNDLVDLHVFILPQELWLEKYHKARNTAVLEAISAGFVRAHPSSKLHQLREIIKDQLGYEIVPQHYIFLRSVGRCLAVVNSIQERALTAIDYANPSAHYELLLLSSADKTPDGKRTNESSLSLSKNLPSTSEFVDENNYVHFTEIPPLPPIQPIQLSSLMPLNFLPDSSDSEEEEEEEGDFNIEQSSIPNEEQSDIHSDLHSSTNGTDLTGEESNDGDDAITQGIPTFETVQLAETEEEVISLRDRILERMEKENERLRLESEARSIESKSTPTQNIVDEGNDIENHISEDTNSEGTITDVVVIDDASTEILVDESKDFPAPVKSESPKVEAVSVDESTVEEQNITSEEIISPAGPQEDNDISNEIQKEEEEPLSEHETVEDKKEDAVLIEIVLETKTKEVIAEPKNWGSPPANTTAPKQLGNIEQNDITEKRKQELEELKRELEKVQEEKKNYQKTKETHSKKKEELLQDIRAKEQSEQNNWKRMYATEKGRTTTLEEEIEKLKKVIESQYQKSIPIPGSKSLVKRTKDGHHKVEAPSERSNQRNMVLKLQNEINELNIRHEIIKKQLVEESTMRNFAEHELKELRLKSLKSVKSKSNSFVPGKEKVPHC